MHVKESIHSETDTTRGSDSLPNIRKVSVKYCQNTTKNTTSLGKAESYIAAKFSFLCKRRCFCLEMALIFLRCGKLMEANSNQQCVHF